MLVPETYATKNWRYFASAAYTPTVQAGASGMLLAVLLWCSVWVHLRCAVILHSVGAQLEDIHAQRRHGVAPGDTATPHAPAGASASTSSGSSGAAISPVAASSGVGGKYAPSKDASSASAGAPAPAGGSAGGYGTYNGHGHPAALAPGRYEEDGGRNGTGTGIGSNGYAQPLRPHGAGEDEEEEGAGEYPGRGRDEPLHNTRSAAARLSEYPSPNTIFLCFLLIALCAARRIGETLRAAEVSVQHGGGDGLPIYSHDLGIGYDQKEVMLEKQVRWPYPREFFVDFWSGFSSNLRKHWVCSALTSIAMMVRCIHLCNFFLAIIRRLTYRLLSHL
jgi:hypothetical protein